MNWQIKDSIFKRRLMETVKRTWPKKYFHVATAAGLVVAGAPAANALNLYDGSQYGNQVEINLNTTLSYTGFYRVNDPSAVLAGPTNANGNDGDFNFRHGITGNQFEALPVFDVRDGDFGLHVSGEFYINTSYLGTNQNDQPGTVNPFSIAKNTDFTSATRNVNGENARLLDAFAFGKHTFADDQSISLKVGHQTLLWGQSLFFTNNGLAAGQAPIDVITAEDLANPQSQQVFLPVGQAVVTYQPARGINIQGYYQFEWQPDNLQGVGSYFSTTDILDKGGQGSILAIVPSFGTIYAYRAPDLRPPSQNGQFGASVQATLGQWDLGLYGLRYDPKSPEVYTFLQPRFLAGPSAGNKLSPGIFQAGNYQLVYPRDIQIYGASFSTNLGAANVAGEVSGRRNMPLVSGAGPDGVDGLVAPTGTFANASTAPLYAVGSTFAAQASTVAFEVVATPTYYDVLSNFVLTFPIGIEYNVLGRSEIDTTMQHSTGNFTFGVTGTYESNWIAGLTYKDYLGKVDTV